MPSPAPFFLALVGPTASGKTALSLEVGRRLEAEIVSMDSRQVYRGMDVGTGKVGLRERGILPHHGLDLKDPGEGYSAGQFARDARGWIRDIRERGRVPILVGGTGFFLRALLQPMFSEPDQGAERVSALRSFLNGLSLERLQQFVSVLDPLREDVAKAGGRHRMTRTVEVALLTGRPLSRWHAEGPVEASAVPGMVFLLQLPRELLYERINRRVEEMMRGGLVEEVEALLVAGYGSGDPGMTGSGYPEVVAFLRGELTREEATVAIQRSHRRYARRQETWFRHQLPGGRVGVDGTAPLGAQAQLVVSHWEGRGRAPA